MGSKSKVNILLVDDRPENLLALEAVLEGLGQNLIKASSGEDALKWVLREDFAVILLDVQMPGMSGLETAQLIKQREKSRTIPIIFLTAINKEETHVFQGYSVGAVDYLFKPFNPEILRSKVSVFVDLALKNKQIKRQAEEISTQKQFNDLILNSAGEGIFGLDGAGHFTFINPAGAQMMGYRIDQLIGRPIHPTLHHTDERGSPYNAEDCPILECLRGGHPVHVNNELFWRQDGSACPVDFTCTPIQQGQSVIGAVVTFMDVTERKRSEEAILRHAAELERANQQLRENERYKDEFLSVISHELRTPLNFIMGFTSILDDEVAGPLNSQQHEYLGKILNGSDRMLLLVNDLLDFAKMQAGKFELAPSRQDYAELVDEVLTTLKPLADQKHISLRANVRGPIVGELDGQRIIQLLTNIVNNAIKFTPEHGSVGIEAFLQDGAVVTEVRDSGIGIAAEDIPKLFTRFRQLDMSTTRPAGGTGLGLSIAKALVEAHGGTITACSPGRDQGSVFRFTLPLMNRDSLPPMRQESESLTGADG